MHIVFDIGGTKTRLAISSDSHNIEKVTNFPTAQNFEEGVDNLVRQIESLSGNQTIESISGGIAAVLNYDKTDIAYAANLPEWAEKNLAKHLKDLFKCEVSLENDAALAALGEAKAGAGLNLKSFIYLTVGTGIGGSWVVNGEVITGAFGFEPGHQTVTIDGPACPSCKQPGHLESYLSGKAIEARYGQIASTITDDAIIEQLENYLVIGLANTFVHWPSEAIILGGGAALHTSWSLERIEKKLAARLNFYPQTPKIKLAKLGDEAGLYGALTLTK